MNVDFIEIWALFLGPIVIGVGAAKRQEARKAPSEAAEGSLTAAPELPRTAGEPPKLAPQRNQGLVCPPPGEKEEQELENDLVVWRKNGKTKKGNLIWRPRI